MELAHLNLIENAGDGIFLLDTEGDFVLINHRMAEMLGYVPDEVRGRSFRAFLSPNWIASADDVLNRLLAGEPPIRLDLEILDWQSRAIPVELTASLVKHGDSVSGMMGIVREVSDRKALEAKVLRYSEEARRKAEEMATIVNIGLSVTRSFNPAEVLRLIYAQLRPVMTFSAFAIALTGSRNDEICFDFVAEHGEPKPPFRCQLDQSGGLCGWVIRHARPLLIGNWKKERDNFQQREWEHQQRERVLTGDWHEEGESYVIEPVLLTNLVSSWLGVPLVAQERTIGVIALFNETPYAYDEQHQRLLWAIADQAAMAINNARLYEEQRRRAIQLETVREVIQCIVPMLNMNELLNQVVTQIQARFGYDHVHIFLVGDDVKETVLEYRAGTGPVAQEMLRQKIRLPIGEDGFVGWVAATGEPILCNDVTAHPHYRYYAPLAKTQAEISVPLRYGEWVLGVLDVQNERKDSFDTGDLFVLQSLADFAAVSIENVHLFGKQRQHIQELTTLNRISETIVSSLDEDKTLTAIMQQVHDVFQVAAGSLMLVENDRLVFRVSTCQHAEIVKRHTLKMGQGIAGWVAQHGRPLLVPDVHSDPRWCPDVDIATNFQTKTILCVPMKTKDETIGVIQILNPLDGRSFSLDDQNLLESIATSAVIAIENVQLYQQTQQRLEEVSTLYTLAQKMTSSPELPVVLDIIVNILRHVLNCRGCCIFLLDEKTQQLQIQASAGIALEGRENVRIRIGEGVSGQVVERAEPIYIPDTRQEPNFKYFNQEIRSLLVVPLITKDRVIGTLSVDDLKEDAFSAYDGRLLTIAAAQAAVVIENAQLFEHLKERAKRLEEAYAELQEVDRKKEEFVQNVSHELRTPLTFVKAYVELFLDGALGPVTDSQRESMGIVAQRTDAIIQLVNDILTLKKMDRGSMEQVPVAMGPLVQAAVQSAKPTAAQVGLAVQAEITEPLPLIYGDPARLSQVLDNLLHNAIKFSPDGGTTITVRARPMGQAIQVEVSDQGIGIPVAELGKIFDRFYQVDGSSTRRFPGTGLGLAIVKQIIEAHNGKIWVESEEGKGSTFFFTLSPD